MFAKYQFGAIHTADITDGKVTNRALNSAESYIFRRLYLPTNKLHTIWNSGQMTPSGHYCITLNISSYTTDL